MGCGASCMSSASTTVLQQRMLAADCDNVFHQLRTARLNLYLNTVSRNPEAFIAAVERRRQEHDLFDSVDGVSLPMPLLAADGPREREEACED